MKKDYSDYKPTKNEIYNLNRSDRENVGLKYFYNYARFSKDDKRIHITVDEGNEYFSMNPLIEEYTGEEITAKNFANDTELSLVSHSSGRSVKAPENSQTAGSTIFKGIFNAL